LEPINRRSGIRLDAARLDFELGRRAVTARELAETAGIPEATLSRARHGQPVRETTLRKLSDALVRTPVVVGADMLLASPPEKKTASLPSTSEAVQEVGRVSGATSR
jgi:hypothetical protein